MVQADARVPSEEGWRETTINWDNILERIVADYAEHASLDHNVQKDAIQNAWDARRTKRGVGWECRLEYVTDASGHQFISVADKGTTGLTGRVLAGHEYDEDLPEIERWARFESLAFTHDAAAGDFLGARGQGKFIFVAAARNKRMLYDTLRADGVYRLGERRVTRTSSPVISWDGEEAVRRLRAFSPDLVPLAEPGTRVIIDEPVEALATSFVDGGMVRNVLETWWPIIQKLGAKIIVATRDSAGVVEQIVALDETILLPLADDSRYRIWLREQIPLEYRGTRYLVRRLHVGWDSLGPVRPELDGVGVVRGGMVVARLEMPAVPRNIASAVTGYVELDTELEQEMRKVESPTHYAFNWRGGVAQQLKQLLLDQLEEFARQKLGVGAGRAAREEQQRRDAEKRALELLNRRARELGLLGRTGPGRGGGGGGGGGHPHLPITVQLRDPVLPRTTTRRVEFGESIREIAARSVNNTIDPATLAVSLYLGRGGATVREWAKNAVADIPPKTSGKWVEAPDLVLNETEFEKGPYVIRARVVVIGSAHRPKGYVEKDYFRFWLAEDPPVGGIFDDVVAFDEPLSRVDAAARKPANGWRFEYNVGHPAFKALAGDQEAETDYIFRLMLREMLYVDLNSSEPVLFTENDLRDPRATQRRGSVIVSDVLFDYFGS